MEQIARVILEDSPDILVLTEYRPVPGQVLFKLLESMSYHVAAGVPPGPNNSVCVLSRFPLEAYVAKSNPQHLHRWVPVVIPALDLTLLAVHVPNRSEMWNKREFLESTESFAEQTTDRRALIVGDLNNALPEDFQGNTTIPEAVYLQRLLDRGWVDTWRLLNPGVYEYTWFSHRQNGFRLDHCFASPPLASKIVAATLRHDVRTSGLSDHSALTVSLDL